MSNLNYTLSKIYNNLFTFFNYRNLVPLDSKLDDNEFIKNIFNNEYFIIKAISNKYTKDEINIIKKTIDSQNKEKSVINKHKITYIIIFHYNSEIYSKTQELKKVLVKLKNIPYSYDIMLITKNSISTHVNNFIESIKAKISIINYPYKLFTIIIPEHILSNKHEIISKEDEEDLLNNILYCKKFNLPKIRINDPQIIWSPGNINDIVKITRYDDITGISIYYRIIIG
jgi:DNA-directed RNA polymerase subunit H (RpoH/RPB5)